MTAVAKIKIEKKAKLLKNCKKIMQKMVHRNGILSLVTNFCSNFDQKLNFFVQFSHFVP